MKKFIFFIGSIIVSAILLVVLFIVETRNISKVGSVFGILFGLNLPISVKLFIDCLDISPWQIQLRKLRRGNVLKRNDKVKVSFNYLFRIKVKDKYLLVTKADGSNKYQPVGGNYIYSNEEKLFLFKHFLINTNSEKEVDDLNDYQLYVRVKDLKKFVNRFNQTKSRESLNDLSRAFKEQLVENGILEFGHLQYRYCGRHITPFEKNKHSNCYELFFTDIVELIPDEEQKNIINVLYERKSEKYYFATSEEIRLSEIAESEVDLYEKIDDNSIKVLREIEKELNSHENNVNHIYDVNLHANCNLELKDTSKINEYYSDSKTLEEFTGRRGNRFVGVLSLLVITGTIFSVVFKIMMKVINVWPTEGIVYQYMQVLMSFLVTSLIIVIFRAVYYCLFDLQRYDVKRIDLNHLDEKSDNSYAKLIWYFKFCLVICMMGLVASSPIVLFDEGTKVNFITGSILIVVIILICCMIGISQAIKLIKTRKIEFIKNIMKDFFMFIIIAVSVYLIGLKLVISNASMIQAEFKNDGFVVINLESSENYADIDILIYDGNNQLLWKHSVDDTELLKAKEDKYISGSSNEITKSKSQGILINSEILYSYYSLDLNKIINSMAGNYFIEIISQEKGKKVQLINSFVYDDTFTYSKDKMEKEY
ncbi:hypothetical protein LAD12857_00470 [Lacrimispora amygdalina]|uniref:CD-NTase-associated protein 16 NUDIX domain-containing protein n=1 Tax=Lacrimispora amygdalina TaxID=253257 RepID=A0ABQ5LZE6_9FIRM